MFFSFSTVVCGHYLNFLRDILHNLLQQLICDTFRTSGDPVYMYSMGGLAEYCVVPANGLAVIPESLPYSESAILGCAVFTAYGAMKNAADMRAGETVAIIGTGGVGSRYRPSL